MGALAIAMAEDGTCLVCHLCSSLEYVSHDLGVTSTWHHTAYAAYCGDYELELIPADKMKTHEGLAKALKLNEEQYQASLNGRSQESSHKSSSCF